MEVWHPRSECARRIVYIMFFDGWYPIIRTLAAGGIAYIALIFILRLCGKRTLSKWNAFDLIVTIALGSTLATVVLSKDVSVAQGVLALSLLVSFQVAVTWLSVRWNGFSDLVKAEPTLLFAHGEFLAETMKNARVTEGEILGAIRGANLGNIDDVLAVVLETDGSFSVIPASESNRTNASALRDVRGWAVKEKSRA